LNTIWWFKYRGKEISKDWQSNEE